MSIKIKLNNDWVDTNIQAVRGVNHVNSEDVYTKEETEKKFATKTEVQTQINNSITKENIENTIEAWLEEDNESTNGEVYTKQESDALFSGKVSKTDIVQSTGTSETAVMSQKAVSDFENAIRDQVNNYKPIVIEGNVTNAADEEDITSENGLLKLKGRSALNGMGYVILRQNKDFVEQVTKTNTIYEIRYDFDLNGAEITIPENCVLKFNGGSLNNGTIVFNQTIIDAPLYQIFHNIVTEGYSPSDCQVEWFGAKAYSKLDTKFTYSSDAIQNALDSCFNNIYFNVGVYYIDKTLEMSNRKFLNFKGQYANKLYDTPQHELNDVNASTLCVLSDIDILHINCTFVKNSNDIHSSLKILGYGVFDASKVENYNSIAVKINVHEVWLSGCIIEAHLIKRPISITTIQDAESENYGSSVGIELNNDSKSSLSIYGCTINGTISNFRYGIKNNCPKVCYPTSFFLKCNIANCVTAVDFGESGIEFARLTGSIQTSPFFTEDNKNKYPLFTGFIKKVYFNCLVWDLGIKKSSGLVHHNNIMELKVEDTPIIGDLFKVYKYNIFGSKDSLYYENKYQNYISEQSSYKRNSDYYIDFLTDDYFDYTDYELTMNGFTVEDSPFLFGGYNINGMTIKPKQEDNGKSMSLKFNVIPYVSISKIIVESNKLKVGITSYFKEINVSYYNNEDSLLISHDFKKGQERTNSHIISVNDYSSGVKYVIITFKDFAFINDSSFSFIVKAMGFRHSYKHINNSYNTSIRNGGVFSLHGNTYYTITEGSKIYLYNTTNKSYIYSTSGMPKYTNKDSILTDVHDNITGYGSGCRFYMYDSVEPKTFIFDREENKLFKINMIDSEFKERGTFAEKPLNPYIGYQFFCTDKQTTEGQANGIMIYHKGNNIWVDALGRVVV